MVRVLMSWDRVEKRKFFFHSFLPFLQHFHSLSPGCYFLRAKFSRTLKWQHTIVGAAGAKEKPTDSIMGRVTARQFSRSFVFVCRARPSSFLAVTGLTVFRSRVSFSGFFFFLCCERAIISFFVFESGLLCFGSNYIGISEYSKIKSRKFRLFFGKLYNYSGFFSEI